MRKATESLINTTFMADNPLFSCHDNVTELDWEKINEWLERTHLSEQEMSLIWFLGYLDGQNDYNLEQTHCLDQDDLLAILDALKIEWSGIELQENL